MTSRRTVLRIDVAAAATIGLAGCGGSEDTWTNADLPHDAASGGQTRAELESALHALPGVTDLQIEGWRPNAKGNVGVSFRFALEPDHTIADGPALITYLVQSAWSVRDGYMPNSSITISIRSSSTDPFDGPAAARAAGWLPPDRQLGRFNPGSGYSVTDVWLPGYDGVRADAGLGARENLERLGTWPAEAPAVPDGLIVPRR